MTWSEPAREAAHGRCELLVLHPPGQGHEFESLRAGHRVNASSVAVGTMRHPLVGSAEVTRRTLRADRDQRIVVVTSDPGSACAHALVLVLVLLERRIPCPMPLRRPAPRLAGFRHSVPISRC
uniref:MmyB-like transcription regulator ligand binding domain-containing protein n=1 Tax=Streptomyces sp. NBC_01401 TaxID=2903854 RepID=A0AAU3H6P0_9ACTN